MSRRLLLLSSALLVAGTVQTLMAQVFTSLLNPPSARALSLADAMVANPSDDPAAILANPACLGLFDGGHMISFSRNSISDIEHISGISGESWYRTYSFTAGIRLDSARIAPLPLAVGLGYANTDLHLDAWFPWLDEAWPNETWEQNSNQVSMGLGFDYGIRGSFGATYRHAVAHDWYGTTRADLYDWGALVDVPFSDFLFRRSEPESDQLGVISPVGEFCIGTGVNNLGNLVQFDQRPVYYRSTVGTAGSFSAPLPRQARMGMSLKAGAHFSGKGIEWDILSANWSIESSDLLWDPLHMFYGNYTGGYLPFPGDIRIVHDLLLGRSSTNTTKKRGWELSAAEFVTIRGGIYEGDSWMNPGNYSGGGFGIQLKGLVKMLRAIDASLPKDGLAGFIIDHVNIRYDEGSNDARDIYDNYPSKYSAVSVFFAY